MSPSRPPACPRPCRRGGCSRPRATCSIWLTPGGCSAPSIRCGRCSTGWAAGGGRGVGEGGVKERQCGALQGLNKADMARQYGADQVLLWRRSYDTPPPALAVSAPRCERSDRRYAGVPAVPLTECLKDTVARVLPFWTQVIAPAIVSGQRVVLVAHGNSIRALVKYLDRIAEADIVGLNIPNAIPLVYELDANLSPIRHYYLGDADAAAQAAAAVAAQGQA